MSRNQCGLLCNLHDCQAAFVFRGAFAASHLACVFRLYDFSIAAALAFSSSAPPEVLCYPTAAFVFLSLRLRHFPCQGVVASIAHTSGVAVLRAFLVTLLADVATFLHALCIVPLLDGLTRLWRLWIGLPM